MAQGVEEHRAAVIALHHIGQKSGEIKSDGGTLLLGHPVLVMRSSEENRYQYSDILLKIPITNFTSIS